MQYPRLWTFLVAAVIVAYGGYLLPDNDNPEQADQTRNGTGPQDILPPGDEDWYTLQLKPGKETRVYSYSSNQLLRFELYDENLRLVHTAQPGNDGHRRIDFTPDNSTYYLRAFADGWNIVGFYSVHYYEASPW